MFAVPVAHRLAAHITARLLVSNALLTSNLAYWLRALCLAFWTVMFSALWDFRAHDSAVRFSTLHSASMGVEPLATHRALWSLAFWPTSLSALRRFT
jgi:hypothetical protein